MKSVPYVIGFITGLLSVAIFSIIVYKIAKKKGKQVEYDERQVAKRGEAYKTGFKAFSVCQILVMCNEIGFGIHIMDGGLLQFTILIIGLVAFIIHAMWNDAYFLESEKKKVWIILMLVATVVNLLCFFLRDLSTLKTEDGLLSYAFINLEVAFFCLIVLGNGIIKMLVDKNTEKSEIEE